MPAEFRQIDRETPYLFPPLIEDWLPEEHLARFVVDIVAQLNLEPLRNAYSGRGSVAYNPQMLLALLFYGYAIGVFSSRRLERATYDSVPFRYIAANDHPDHDTIASFRKRFLPELSSFFVQILQIAHELDVLKLGRVSLDGTKIKANASKHKALSWEYACKLEEQLKAEVSELMRQAEEADVTEQPDGLDIPEELARRQERLARIAEAKAEIERRATQRYAEEHEEYEKKVQERHQKAEESGRKPRGREPQAPTPGARPKDQVNLTDGDSRIMPTSGKGFEQAYNAQACVDVDTMLIVEQHVTQNTNDKREMGTALEGMESLPEELDGVKVILADAGYYSEDNVEKCVSHEVEPCICVGREGHNPSPAACFSEPEPLADGAANVDKMKHRLKTQEGKALYAKRKTTVEPVFGIIKAVMGFRHFMLRGLEAVRGEWNLVCIACNIKRLHILNQTRAAQGRKYRVIFSKTLITREFIMIESLDFSIVRQTPRRWG